ncbi:MAG: hypothetical protein ACXWUD_10895 [Methylosarcina sp.]
MSRQMKSKRGGKRPGSGRKAGAKNKATMALKEVAAQYSEEAIETLVQVMRAPETSPAVKIQAADKLLDRSHGRPPIHVEPTHLNITPIPWDELREITRKSREEALRKHKEFIEGRYERLGIPRDYQGDY